MLVSYPQRGLGNAGRGGQEEQTGAAGTMAASISLARRADFERKSTRCQLLGKRA